MFKPMQVGDVDKRTRDRARRYGWSTEHYVAVWNAQEGKCAICRRKETKGRILYIDHRHLDGLNRGLLCNRCNSLLGYYNEDIELFAHAASYLETPPALAVLGPTYKPGSPGAAGLLQEQP